MLDKIKLYLKVIVCLFIVAIFWSSLLFGSPLYLVKVSENLIIKNDVDVNQPVIRYIDNQNLRAEKPTERAIILRMDDVQGYLWRALVINLTDSMLQKNMSVTLAVIPNRSLNDDVVMRKYLLDKIKNPRIEIAQHGFNHKENEYLNISEADAYNITRSGQDILRNYLRVDPVTFVPPYDEYNSNTTKTISELGFKIISAKKNEFQFNENIAYIGFNEETKISNQNNLIPVPDVLNACNKSLNDRNLCVIVIHPQDYADNGIMNRTRYSEFVDLLEGLKNLNAKSATFKDLLKENRNG
jgi:peptidoglycan/xylan/chitin deacetylase (PgdA/CDA1 family)